MPNSLWDVLGRPDLTVVVHIAVFMTAVAPAMLVAYRQTKYWVLELIAGWVLLGFHFSLVALVLYAPAPVVALIVGTGALIAGAYLSGRRK